jgi:hypothetical protein
MNGFLSLLIAALMVAAAPVWAKPKTLIDYFLPMPIHGRLTTNAWGAPNVLPRDPQNGLEDPTMKKWCYWDGKIIQGPDRKYHLFASRWDQAKGHNGWWTSCAVEAVSDDPTGPYQDQGLCWPQSEGGKGHNVTALILPDGRYAVVVSETRPGCVFVSRSPDGPWDYLGAISVAGDPEWHASNEMIMVRPDGRFEMIGRAGVIMISTNGVRGPYEPQGSCIYRNLSDLPQDNLEDPVIWFSGGLYHIVVNCWSERKAYHLTSPDGVSHWTNRGLAYDPTTDFLRYTDGTVEHWNKIERPGVFLNDGHVAYFTFAVIDVPKDQELPNDNHGSKVIVVPFDGAALDRDLQKADAEPDREDARLAEPIANVGEDARVDVHGVQAIGYRFQDDCAKPTPWQARWIWTAAGSSAPAVMFRKEITLTSAPSQVTAWLSADMKYLLYVNGRLVSRGPADIGCDYQGGNTRHWFYDHRDLTPFFVSGTNVIAALVFRQWPIGFTVSRGQPGFLFEADVTLPSRQPMTVKSDASWQTLPAAQFPEPTIFDAGREPAGWRLPGFDDRAWAGSSEVKDIWESLVPSEIPPPMETCYPVLRTEGLPEDRTFTNDGSFKVVFDRVLSAYPTLVVQGSPGAELTIKAQRECKLLLGEDRQNFEFPFMDEIAPCFTVELKHVSQPVKIASVGANFTSQPVEYRGAFNCSDDYLNRLWQVSRWVTQICLQTHHLDSPNHQEPICDPGDYVIEDMVNHYAFAQPWLARQDIRKFAWLLKDEHYHNFHTSYSIAWLQMLMDDYDYTGNRALVQDMAPYVAGLLDTYASWRGTNGLISEAPNYMFMDWVEINGFGCHHPPAVIGQGYLTAFYYHALALAEQVAEVTGDTERMRHYAELRREVKTAFNRELWNSKKGLYRDGKPFQTSVKPHEWLPADQAIETFSPHVNLLAVLYDLAPPDKQPSIVEEVMAERPLNTQPWFMYWVFAAIDHAGLFESYAVEQMHRWQIVPETQSFHEMWQGGDLSHGWCASPLVQMSARVLGVTPASPGFDRIAIRPELCDLQWAQGTVPTPHGDVKVSWKLTADGWQMDVTIPAGTQAEVILPASRFRQPRLLMDGVKAHARVVVAAGEHHFVIKGSVQPVISKHENKT